MWQLTSRPVAGVVIGVNQHCAWSITLAYLDCADVVVQRVGAEEDAAHVDAAVAPDAGFTEWEELIHVKGRSAPHVHVALTLSMFVRASVSGLVAVIASCLCLPLRCVSFN